MKREIVECGKGWETLYLPIIENIIKHDNACRNVDEKIGIGQVKEKWGALEIYTLNPKNLTPTIKEDISNAYMKSKRICEYCGETNHVGTTMNHWSITCCKSCWENIIIPKHDDSRWKDLDNNKLYKKEK